MWVDLFEVDGYERLLSAIRVRADKKSLLAEQLSVANHDAALTEFFTDAEYLRDLFNQLVAAPTLAKHIFIVHGVGGIGKTSLLRMFRLHCKNIHLPVALTSGDATKSSVDVLGKWANDLRLDGVVLPGFAKTFDHFRKLAKSVAEAITETVLSTIPGFGPSLGQFGGSSVEALADWLRAQGFSNADIDLLLDPVKKLTDDFIADIETIALTPRIVLMLDTYEKMTGREEWMCDLAQRLPQNLLLVVAGRGVPDWDRRWVGWLAKAEVEEIEVMQPEVMRELVQRYYRTLTQSELDILQAEGIIEFARGMPLAVTSAVDLMVKYHAKDFQAITPKVINDLAKRLQEDVPDDLRLALQAAAAVRWFDEPILRALIQEFDVTEDYDELQRFPFVVVRDIYFALHDVVRDTLDANLRARDLERHRELHGRAAKYFHGLIDNSRLLPGISEEWQKLTSEEVYHLLQAEEGTGLDLLSTLFELGIRYLRYQYCHTLLHDAESLRLSNSKSKHRLGLLRVRLVAAELSWAYVDEDDLHALVKDSDLDPETKWDVFLSYAKFLEFAGKHKEAREYYEKSS